MFKSFKYAIRGIGDALKSEYNLSIHFLVSVLAFILAIFLKFTFLEFAILTLTIFFVITLELINTIIEKIMDITSPEISEKVRVIKDISAAIVLFGAVASIIIGIFLFIPKLL